MNEQRRTGRTTAMMREVERRVLAGESVVVIVRSKDFIQYCVGLLEQRARFVRVGDAWRAGDGRLCFATPATALRRAHGHTVFADHAVEMSVDMWNAVRPRLAR